MQRTRKYSISFRCYYNTNWTDHRQEMRLSEIPKWIEAYIFTHPQVESITVKVWPQDEEI